jgi:hypothetical protein
MHALAVLCVSPLARVHLWSVLLQMSEAIASMQAATEPGSREAQALSSMVAPTAVGLGVGSDWVTLDGGRYEQSPFC